MYDWSSRVCGSMIWYSSSTPIVRDGGFIVGSTEMVYLTARRQTAANRRRQTADGRLQRADGHDSSAFCHLPTAVYRLRLSAVCRRIYSPLSLPRLHEKRRHRRPATRSDVQQRRGRESGEVAFHILTVAHERGRVEHTIDDLHRAVYQTRVRLVRNPNPLLDDVRRRERARNGLFPRRIVNGPT